ncbi:MAG: hypothetical protein AAF715_07385 [Myxococcota bacterium]
MLSSKNSGVFVSVIAVGCLLTAGTGCSEGVGPAATGAYAVPFVQSTGSCAAQRHDGAYGSVTTTEKLTLFTDGQARENLPFPELNCLVRAEGDGFRAAGSIDDNVSDSLAFDIPNLSPDATRENPSLGSIQFLSPLTSGVYGTPGDVPCEFFIRGEQAVQPGAVWVSFLCPSIRNGASDCAVGDPGMTDPRAGVVVMENCQR